MYDHEIFPERDIDVIDMISILLLSLYIVFNNIYLTVIIALIIILLFKEIKNFAGLFYIIGLFKVFYNLFTKNINAMLLITIFIISAIVHYDNNVQYKMRPFHISWKPYNALIWHICNACIYLQ